MTCVAYIVATCDTKGAEATFVRDRLQDAGLTTRLVDVGTRGATVTVDVDHEAVAACHPDGQDAVLSLDDRGSAVGAMADAFTAFILARGDVAGVIGLGGSGGTAIVSAGMQALPIGLPKVIVSTMASGDVGPYVGANDITMMPSITDIAGLNSVSRRILANGAHALAGMLQALPLAEVTEKPALGLTMFGVTTPCVTAICDALSDRHDCLVFHATGTGGQAMERLVDSGFLAGVIDITTTEVCDELFGGILSAGPDRIGAIARTGIPYVGSCGALDMVNFGGAGSVPERYRDRQLYVHNPHVTLMRTTPDENTEIGRWIGARLNACDGPVRFLLPEGGVSLIDAPGQPFEDQDARTALFAALEEIVHQTPTRRLIRVPHAINDPEFAQRAVAEFLEIAA